MDKERIQTKIDYGKEKGKEIVDLEKIVSVMKGNLEDTLQLLRTYYNRGLLVKISKYDYKIKEK